MMIYYSMEKYPAPRMADRLPEEEVLFMNILPANESHIPGMIRLLQQVGEVHHQIRPDIFCDGCQKYDEAALQALLQDPMKPIFIAEQQGEVAGYCFCVRKEIPKNRSLLARKELYIDDLCVDEHCRRQGIAKKLFAHACAYARELGYDAVNLNVWCGNDGAMRLYEQLGMKPRNIMMEIPLEDVSC